MPIREYECSKCGATFEQLLRKASEKPKGCPKCGASSIRQALSAFSVSTRGRRQAAVCEEKCPSTAHCKPGHSCPFSGR